jgi:hypothetical protein
VIDSKGAIRLRATVIRGLKVRWKAKNRTQRNRASAANGTNLDTKIDSLRRIFRFFRRNGNVAGGVPVSCGREKRWSGADEELLVARQRAPN